MRTDARLAPTALCVWVAALALTAAPQQAAAVLGLCAAAIVVAVVLAYERVPAAAQCALVAAGIALVALSVHTQQAARHTMTDLAAQAAQVTLSGQVTSDGREAYFGGGQQWTLEVHRVQALSIESQAAGTVQVTAAGPVPPYGAQVNVQARLSPPRDPSGAVVARASASHVALVKEPSPLHRTTTAMRNGLLDATADMSGQARGLVPGIAVGDDSRLPVQLDQHFRSTSLTHLTAVSGGHFAIVLTMLTAAAAALHLPRGLRATLIAACAGAFVLLVRPEPSVLRAAAMCAVTLLAIILGRRAASIPALATCTIVLLAGDPWLARSYGFALSCAATAGLVLLTPALTARLTPWIGRTAAFAMAVPWAAQLACGPIVMMFAPGIPTTSIPANLLASPAVAPATLLGLASALISPWCAWGARALAWLASGATWWIAQVATRCANLPGARLPWPGGIGGALLLAGFTAAGLAALLRKPPADGWAAGHPLNLPAHYARSSRQLRETHRAIRARQQAGMTSRRDRRMVTALAACLGVIVLAIGLSLHGAVRGSRAASTPANWQIVMCDVGQGDSLLVRSGSASAVVVDVGPHEPAESGGRSGDAGACLTRLGVTKVDLLVLTHFHADHVGGLAGLLVGRDVERVLVSALPQPSDGAHSVSSLLAAAGIAVEVPQTGLSGTVGGGSDGWAVDWTVVRADGALARPAVPPAPTASTDSDPDSSPHPGAGAACCSTDGLTGDPNDASVALSITSTGPGGKVSLLALGDLEEDGQNALLQALRQARSPLLDGVDVVKIAHHGSASQSSGLAQALHPRLALIGVGARNTYGHPTQEALTLYEEHGATILRTDLCGTGAVVVGGGRLSYACMAR